MSTISVVIPIVNSEVRLKQFLSRNVSYLNQQGITDIIVVDDGSDDDSVVYLQTHFPQIRLIRNKVNKGVSVSLNRGVSIASGDVVLLLHCDVLIETLDIEGMVSVIQRPDVFAVVPPVYDHITHALVSYTRGSFIGAEIVFEECKPAELDIEHSKAYPVLWATTAAMFVRKECLLMLGGFDPMYAPFYGEDIDIAYRAWKQGLSTLYYSSGCVIHYSEYGMASGYTKQAEQRIKLVHTYLFIWKNITAKTYLLRHVLIIVLTMLTFRIRLCGAILESLVYMPKIIMYRFRKGLDVVTDQEVLGQWTRKI